jgi:hypothetical protein
MVTYELTPLSRVEPLLHCPRCGGLGIERGNDAVKGIDSIIDLWELCLSCGFRKDILNVKLGL